VLAKRASSELEELNSPDHHVKVHAVPLTETNTKGASGMSTTVVDATIDQCASWEMLKLSRSQITDHYAKGGQEIGVAKISNHSHIYRKAKDLKFKGLAVREWITKVSERARRRG
jgi:predicted ATP-grasp superfamily ATP-dependent carboligase